MVAYEYEMLERFLENSVYLDIPLKYVLLEKVQCVVMFSLKIMLKNVQRMNVSPSYINSVVLNGTGERAMMLASKVACDFYSNDTIEYISNSPSLASDTNVCSSSEHTFCDELKSFFDKKDTSSLSWKSLLKRTQGQLLSQLLMQKLHVKATSVDYGGLWQTELNIQIYQSPPAVIQKPQLRGSSVYMIG